MHKRVVIRGMDGRRMLALKQASSDDPNAGHQRDPYLFIVTSAQLRSRCDVWLAVKASLQTVHHVLHAASESGS